MATPPSLELSRCHRRPVEASAGRIRRRVAVHHEEIEQESAAEGLSLWGMLFLTDIGRFSGETQLEM